MIKGLQRRFVRVAMASFFVVLATLLLGLNGLNFWQTVQELDGEAVTLMDQPRSDERKTPPPPHGEGLDMRSLWQNWQGRGGHADRYAYAKTDAEGQLLTARLDRMDDMTEAQLITLLEPLATQAKTHGWVGLYRYYQRTTAEGQREWLLMDAGRQLQAVTRLGLISLGIFVGSLLIIYGLLRYFSGRAIRPMLENIERQREFISNASHEIKTPLAVLATNNDVLEMVGTANEWTESNRRQLARLNRLVEQMLQLARYDEGQLQLLIQPHDAVISLARAIEALQPMVAAQATELVVNLPHSLTLNYDEDSFQTVCQVLLENALAYHTPGQPIEWGWRPDSHSFYIRNACPPMTQAQAERLFERFYRPDQSRQRAQGGNGMGLSLAKAVARLNGWQLTVHMVTEQVIEFRLDMGRQK